MLEAVEAYGAQHPRAYAGVFVTSWVILTGWTSGAYEHGEELRRQLGSVCRAFEADYSLEELLRIKAELSARIGALGDGVVGVGVNVPTNRVVVTALDPATVSLPSRYRGVVQVRRGELPRIGHGGGPDA